MSLIAVGGGKGGVGRSLVASGLAVFLAQLGKKVLLVDGHPYAPPLATTFGVVRIDGTAAPWAPLESDPRGAETIVPNLRLLAANVEPGARSTVSLRHPREVAAASASDHCVLDLGPGVATPALDAMLDADVMLLVTTPEPAAVEAVYKFLRHAYARALARRLKGRPVELEQLRKTVRDAGGPPMPPRLAEEVARVSTFGAETAWSELSRLRARLVVNASRSRADLDLGDAVAMVAQQQMSLAVEYLGHVEFDESVVMAARRRRPLLVDVPAAKASRNVERIARRLSAPGGVREHPSEPSTEPPPPPTHYDVLAIDRGASDEEIRRAYRRLRDVYTSDSIAMANLLTEPALATAVARIEEARDVLLDSTRRRPYDLSITTSDALASTMDEAGAPPNAQGEPAMVALPDLTPETEFTGEILRRVREARGAELRDVSARTKISVANLRAIEDEAYDQLPAPVYLRGFVAEVAKYLRLDPEQVTRTYLRRCRHAAEKS